MGSFKSHALVLGQLRELLCCVHALAWVWVHGPCLHAGLRRYLGVTSRNQSHAVALRFCSPSLPSRTPQGVFTVSFKTVLSALSLCMLAASLPVQAETIGSVDTVFKWVGPDHKIVVDAYDDPLVEGVSCYVSRAKKGGIKGGLGLAEDRSEASLTCHAVGTIVIKQPLKQQDEVFSERISVLFKHLRVVRMVDAKRNTLVYMTYADRVIEGSPQNSVTAVPVPRSTPIPVKK